MKVLAWIYLQFFTGNKFLLSLWLCLTSHFSAPCSSHPFLCSVLSRNCSPTQLTCFKYHSAVILEVLLAEERSQDWPWNSFFKVILCPTLLPVTPFLSPSPSSTFLAGLAGCLGPAGGWAASDATHASAWTLEGRNCSWFHHPWKAWDLHPVLHLCVQGPVHARCQTPCWGNKNTPEHQQLPSHCRESGRATTWFPGRMSSLRCVPRGHHEFILAGDGFLLSLTYFLLDYQFRMHA